MHLHHTLARPRRATGRALALAAALVVAATLVVAAPPHAQAAAEDTYDGSQLWLRYVPVSDPGLLDAYRRSATAIVVDGVDDAPVHRATPALAMAPGSTEQLVDSTLQAARDELVRGLDGLLGRAVPVRTSAGGPLPVGAVVVGTPDTSATVRQTLTPADLAAIGEEGYVLRSTTADGSPITVIAGATELGALYGTFAFLRRLQTGKPLTDLDVTEAPRVRNRHLNNWETIRLYAGNNAAGTGGTNGENGSIFNFSATGASASRNLPVILDRYLVMARALASVGVNGITVNLVNANNVYLTPAYIAQEAALADALRPYGIRIALAVNYTAPTDARFAPDRLTNAQLDPKGEAFQGWWFRKASQIQAAIPDFTGFTVKANSEGQPGPQDFGYDHGDGANGMAAAVAPLGMKIYWRTFVYNADVDPDRLKRAYLEFGAIDDEVQPDGTRGRLLDNVFLQTKNGPLDFQPREPFHPMFGRMENSNQAMELQITQEYTGQSTMLVYLGGMWEEVLKTDTSTTGEDGELLEHRLVGHIVDGTAQGHADTAIVGVANLGNAANLTGHHVSQANLFAFGRQAWDWTLDAEDIARDWVRMTWSDTDRVVDTIVQMMMGSWEAIVSYQQPLGVAHQFRSSDHYGPNPGELFVGGREDWSPPYYNRASVTGLGYDRSPSGSNFVAQYFPELEARYGDIDSVPEDLLLWFHHVPWDRTMRSGRPFWDELVYRYQMGVQYVTWMREAWDSLQPHIDARRFAEVKARLVTHEADAASWRDTCVAYFQRFSARPVPVDDGPLSITVVVDGRQVGGFNLSKATHRVGVNPGGSPRITDVITADPDARYEIVSQATSVPGQAVVKVTADGPFGPLVKRYTFQMEHDVNGTAATASNVLSRVLP
jgi:alpha-glucuronidase